MSKKTKRQNPTKKPVRTAQANKGPNSNSRSGILSGVSPIRLLLLVAALTLIVYLPATQGEFVRWDDPEYTFENPFLKDFDAALVFDLNTFHMGNYHPLTIAWYHFESKIFGFDPFWFHLNNILIHVANTALVFWIFFLIGKRKNVVIPAITALLFGIHPMHVESVAWVSELKDVLYTLFFLLGIWFYMLYLEKKGIHWLFAVLLAYVLSLLSKGQAVVFPVVLVLIDLFQKRGLNLKSVLEKLPFFGLSVYFGLLAIKAQQAGDAINADYQGLDVLFYGSYGLVFYFQKLLLPFGLSGAHPYPFNPVFEEMPGMFKIYPLVILMLFAGAFLWARKSSYVWFGLLFFLSTISIVLKLIPVGDTIVAERYTYIPYIGLFFILASLADQLLKDPKYTQAITYGGIAVLLLFFGLTFLRIGAWADTETFWTDVNEKYPDYWRGYNNRAEDYKAAEDYPKAAEYFQLAIEKDKFAPPIPYLQLGSLYQEKLNQPAKAIELFQKAADFPNKGDKLHFNARINLANSLIMSGRGRDALNSLKGLDQLFGMDPQIHYLRGRAYTDVNQVDSALQEFNAAIEGDPNKDDYWLKRGILYTDRLSDPLKGIADFEKALQLNPNNYDALMNIGVSNYKAGRMTEAIATYTRYLEIRPNEPKAYMLRALAYGGNGESAKAYADAMEAAKRGLNMDPNLVERWRVGG
ncbi:MAG: tetratricopeptide repeat protein [Flavobacteriales bacterium]|nr:tetratricopeptide repeat protein [Flavobacteriales bacterium]